MKSVPVKSILGDARYDVHQWMQMYTHTRSCQPAADGHGQGSVRGGWGRSNRAVCGRGGEGRHRRHRPCRLPQRGTRRSSRGAPPSQPSPSSCRPTPAACAQGRRFRSPRCCCRLRPRMLTWRQSALQGHANTPPAASEHSEGDCTRRAGGLRRRLGHGVGKLTRRSAVAETRGGGGRGGGGRKESEEGRWRGRSTPLLAQASTPQCSCRARPPPPEEGGQGHCPPVKTFLPSLRTKNLVHAGPRRARGHARCLRTMLR